MKTSDSYGFKEEYEVRLLLAVLLSLALVAITVKEQVLLFKVVMLMLFLEVVIEILPQI